MGLFSKKPKYIEVEVHLFEDGKTYPKISKQEFLVKTLTEAFDRVKFYSCYDDEHFICVPDGNKLNVYKRPNVDNLNA